MNAFSHMTLHYKLMEQMPCGVIYSNMAGFNNMTAF